MTDITINFKNASVTVKQNKEGLYRLNDVHRAAGGEGQLNDLLKNTKQNKLRRFSVVKVGGRNGGTYANEIGVYWFAAKFDDDFEEAVFEAFKQAVRGEGDKAVSTAQQVVRLESKRVRKLETDALKEFQEAKGYYKSKGGVQQFGRLTKFTNDLLGIGPGMRDELTPEDLTNIITVEKLVTKIFKEAIKADASFESALKLINKRVTVFLDYTN